VKANGWELIEIENDHAKDNPLAKEDWYRYFP
jgi:hypothetical protein